MNNIVVGDNTNIQDGVTVHVARHNPQGRAAPTLIGNNVTIGLALWGAPIQRCNNGNSQCMINLQRSLDSVIWSTSFFKPGAVYGAGHGAIIHAATVEDNVLVGMGATILDGVTVSRCN